MTLHTIEPKEGFLVGKFSPDIPPVLTVESGDTVRYQTLDAGWGLTPPVGKRMNRELFSPRTPGRDDGHALAGPVAIRGLEAGGVLEIRIDAVVPGAWGWTAAATFDNPLNRSLGIQGGPDYEQILNWDLDTKAMTGRNQYGHTVALRPFMGIIGMPPPEPGMHPTPPPRRWGGNIDCKLLIAGSTLYLPVPVAGGMVLTGDGHAVQGDGEVSLTAIECPMERVDLTYIARNDLHWTMPRANTSAGWVTFGFDEDLNVAMAAALNGMLDLLVEQYGLSRADSLSLASVAVDLHITQVVNGVRGVHAILPHGAIR